MAWTTPRTWAVGEAATAAKMNEISADLVDLDRRTSPVAAFQATLASTTSTSFVDLTGGPAVTVTIGSTNKCLVSLYANLSNTGLQATLMSYRVSGASTVAAADDKAIGYTPGVANVGARIGCTILHTGLTAGSTTFTVQGRSTSGSTQADFRDMRIAATPLGS